MEAESVNSVSGSRVEAGPCVGVLEGKEKAKFTALIKIRNLIWCFGCWTEGVHVVKSSAICQSLKKNKNDKKIRN